MITQERLPTLGWRPPARCHIFGDRGLTDIEAKLEQLAMNARSAPEWVCKAHVTNELSDLKRHAWPTTPSSRSPPPIGSKGGAMPADHRLGFDNCQSLQDARSEKIQPGKHEAINVAEGYSLRAFTPQHIELVSKNQNFRFQCSPRPEYSDQGAPDQLAEVPHPREYHPIR